MYTRGEQCFISLLNKPPLKSANSILTNCMYWIGLPSVGAFGYSLMGDVKITHNPNTTLIKVHYVLDMDYKPVTQLCNPTTKQAMIIK